MENNENESVEDIFSLGIINEEETSGYKKIQNYLNGIIDEPAFQEKILKLRGKYKIPDKGLEKDDFPWDIIYKEDFNNDLQNLCFIDLGLSFEWFGCIKNYVCYNNLDCASGSMFSLLDLNFRLNIFPRQTGTVDGEVKDLQEKAKTHPIAILINTYASERDILDYVKNNYESAIKPAQQIYRKSEIKIGKIRKRSSLVKERNQFISDNDNLPSDKIVSMVANKYKKILDYCYVNRIISKKKTLKKAKKQK